MVMADSKLIKIENLSKRFDSLVVLDDISLEVDHAENLVVFGKSGTGKSVLLKCIIGLLHPEQGKIFINDKNVLKLSLKELNEVRKNIGFLNDSQGESGISFETSF